MAKNNFTKLEEEEVNPKKLEDIKIGLMQEIQTSRSLAAFAEFLVVKLKSFIINFLGGKSR